MHAVLYLVLALACVLLPIEGVAQDRPLLSTRASLAVEITETPDAAPLIISVFEDRIVD